jgi:hypothetical protein
MLLAWGRGNGTKRKIVSNSPYEGEYARIRSNIVVRYQGSIHGLIFTHKNGPIFLTASKAQHWSGHVQLHANGLLPFSSASVSDPTVSRVCFGSFWDHASFEKMPQRYNQFARQSDDRNPPHSPRRVSNARAEPPR